MLKVKLNPIYPIIIGRFGRGIKLYSKEFNIEIVAQNLPQGIHDIKKAIVVKIADLHENNKDLPIADYEGLEDKTVTYIEIDSVYVNFLTERINLSIPKNLLAMVDDLGLNRSNYISRLIKEDLLKKLY